MEFSSFTLILTDECNFNCSYCYQKGGEKTLDVFTVENALDFFLPYLKEHCYINFTGGEPLLAFEQIRKAIDCIQVKNRTLNKKIHYSITTNGSLINDDILQFLKQHEFSSSLSFDGIAQDISREKGSYKQVVSVIEKILESQGIALETNSVFTPATVGYLSKSIQFLMELGVTNINLALSKILFWNSASLLRLEKELRTLKRFILSFYKKTGAIPLTSFKRDFQKGIFTCIAGKNLMALAPDGRLWGCHLFPEHFKGKEGTPEYHKYCFGNLGSFIEDHERIYPEVLANYSNLRMDYFYTDDNFCKKCPELEECWACPLDAAFSSSIIGKIPGWTCKIKKIFRKEKEIFWKELETIK
jgi:sulfatase maturation enzyme AslB (radical SAM superfamily)